MRPGVYRNYLLGLLTVIVVFNYVDRLALGILLQDIKVDLQLTDTELGLLSGLAFALFYSVMGIPIARWADRGNRVTIISVTAVVWSIAVALCGVATSFLQLLLIRVAVAVGEAGCIPPAFSLIADYFSRAERPRAAAIYGLGGPIASIVGFFFAGWLNELYGWRITFAVLGIPGVVLAALAWFTLREPRRLKSTGKAAALPFSSPANETPAPDQPPMKEVFVTLWANVTFRHLIMCLSVNFFFIYGILQWQPAFFMRSFGLTSGQIGTWFAVIFGVGGLLGTYLGGELAARFAANNERLQLRAMGVMLIVCAAVSVCTYLSSNVYVAFALMAVYELALGATSGPLFATIQTLVPERMRAVSFALVYFVANLVGMGLGPLAAGALSDAFRPWAGEESLRYALVTLAPGYIWSAWHLWRASKTVTSDLAGAQNELSRSMAAQGEAVASSARPAFRLSEPHSAP